MGCLGLLNFSLWCLLVACALVDNKVKSDNSCDIEISETLRTLLNPQEDDSLQVQALRRQLLRKLQEDLDLAELEDERNYKRSLASLAAWNNLPDEHKRNLEALARAGTWYKNPPELDQNDDDANYKRSIANLAKNGQPPLMPLPIENQKRGIEALARNGDLHRPKNNQDYKSLLEAFYDKRNVASLARNYNFPAGNTAGFGKRTISSLAQNGDLPYVYGKRNIQSLARDGAIGKRSTDNIDVPQDKRNIQAIKAQQRTKRQADYFDNEVVYPMPENYEDILQELAMAQDIYPVEDKRFLGRIPQMGKPRTTAIPKSRRYH